MVFFKTFHELKNHFPGFLGVGLEVLLAVLGKFELPVAFWLCIFLLGGFVWLSSVALGFQRTLSS